MAGSQRRQAAEAITDNHHHHGLCAKHASPALGKRIAEKIAKLIVEDTMGFKEKGEVKEWFEMALEHAFEADIESGLKKIWEKVKDFL